MKNHIKHKKDNLKLIEIKEWEKNIEWKLNEKIAVTIQFS